MTLDELRAEFLRIADTGDEAVARKFLTDHIMDFPEEMRQQIVFAFFEEALADKAAVIKSAATLQEEGVQALEGIVREEKEVDNQARIEELKKILEGGKAGDSA